MKGRTTVKRSYILALVFLTAGILLGWFIGSIQRSSTVSSAHEQQAVSANKEIWTCSMHPQIVREERGKCPICGMDLVLTTSREEDEDSSSFTMTETAMALANVETTLVSESQTSETPLMLSGIIKESESSSTVLAAYFPGRIESLNVTFTGERIKKGQLLATVYSPQLVSAQQELLTARTLLETQPDLYAAVRNKLKLWKLTEQQINTLETSKQILENFPIYATISGTVTEKLVNEGDYVKEGDPLFRLAGLETLWAVFDVYEDQLGSLQVGLEMRVLVDALPEEKFNAEISYISPLMDVNSRTAEVRVIVNNNRAMLKPGMFVLGYLKDSRPDSNQEEVVIVPRSAVLWTGTRSVVYVKTSNTPPTFSMREVTLGKQMGNYYQLMSGLEPGEEIVTQGAFAIDATAQLRGKNSMMSLENDTTTRSKDSSTGRILRDEVESIGEGSSELLRLFLPRYIELKDALVASNPSEVGKQAKGAMNLLEEKNDRPLTAWEQEQWNQIKAQLTGCSSTDDIEDQRRYFKQFSERLIALVTRWENMENTLYVQYCPMVGGDVGAHWLSMEEQIRNPYFGNRMLSCGEVQQVLKGKSL